ncbi:MAG: recombinase family protein [Planctomycetota bacterium]
MNVVIWARVSSREQREGYSIDAQLRACRELATKNSWKVVKEFEIAESAKRGVDRVAFNEMYSWVKGNAKKLGIKMVVSHKLDRICRNMRDAVKMQDLEDACEVKLGFVENHFGAGAAGMFSFNIMAAVAQYYSDNLRSEVIKGIDEKVRQGWPSGHAAFGYMNTDNKDEPVVIHPEKGPTVVRIFELYATGKYTFKSLANKLQSEGHYYQTSTPRFGRTGLSFFLNNRFYIGELERGGVVYPGKFKRLIDHKLWTRCQEVLHGRNKRKSSHGYALAGSLIQCKHCGWSLTGERIGRKLSDGSVREHFYYKCGNPESSKHGKVRIKADLLEESIAQKLDTLRLPDQEVMDWFREAIREVMTDKNRVEAHLAKTLKRRLADLGAMKKRLLDAYLTGTVEKDVYNTKLAELNRELAQAETELGEATGFEPGAAETVLKIFDYSQNLGDLWRRSNVEKKREILESCTSNRVIIDATLDVTWRCPFDEVAKWGILRNGRGERI